MTYKGLEIKGVPTLDMVREFLANLTTGLTPEEVYLYCMERFNECGSLEEAIQKSIAAINYDRIVDAETLGNPDDTSVFTYRRGIKR